MFQKSSKKSRFQDVWTSSFCIRQFFKTLENARFWFFQRLEALEHCLTTQVFINKLKELYPEIEETFSSFCDDNGKMHSKDIGKAMRSLGRNPNRADLMELINDINRFS